MSAITQERPRQATRVRAASRRSLDVLGHYTNDDGESREIVCRAGANASRLVTDRLVTTHADERLVAHLAADEPAQNADIVTSLYLADTEGRHCRRLQLDDLTCDPISGHTSDPAPVLAQPSETLVEELIDARGYGYSLRASRNRSSPPELRWQRHPPGDDGPDSEPVSVRHVIGALESYDPARALTAQAVAAHDLGEGVSVAALRAELQRLNASRIVLNRGLREAVLAAVNERGVSMSEIALRCGRFKHDPNGNESGETSWLGRRIGLLAEGGKSAPTPWVSSDVLALIARQGLGVAPHEVELG